MAVLASSAKVFKFSIGKTSKLDPLLCLFPYPSTILPRQGVLPNTPLRHYRRRAIITTYIRTSRAATAFAASLADLFPKSKPSRWFPNLVFTHGCSIVLLRKLDKAALSSARCSGVIRVRSGKIWAAVSAKAASLSGDTFVPPRSSWMGFSDAQTM